MQLREKRLSGGEFSSVVGSCTNQEAADRNHGERMKDGKTAKEAETDREFRNRLYLHDRLDG